MLEPMKLDAVLTKLEKHHLGSAAAALGCDFNRSTQHLNSNYRERGVVYEVLKEKILHSNRQNRDVGPLAERRISEPPGHCTLLFVLYPVSGFEFSTVTDVRSVRPFALP
jgi:hypothetical protein